MFNLRIRRPSGRSPQSSLMPQLRMPIRRDRDFIALAKNAADAAHCFLIGCTDSRVEERLTTTDITSIHAVQ
jgi:hypothetical protein